ncbi:MAG: hypothetical protein ACK55Z_28420, partial [bacterium]
MNTAKRSWPKKSIQNNSQHRNNLTSITKTASAHRFLRISSARITLTLRQANNKTPESTYHISSTRCTRVRPKQR